MKQYEAVWNKMKQYDKQLKGNNMKQYGTKWSSMKQPKGNNMKQYETTWNNMKHNETVYKMREAVLFGKRFSSQKYSGCALGAAALGEKRISTARRAQQRNSIGLKTSQTMHMGENKWLNKENITSENVSFQHVQ